MKYIQNLTLRLTRLLTVMVTVTAGGESGGRGGDAVWKHAGDGHLGYWRGGKVTLPSVQVRDQSGRGEGGKSPYHQCR